jgi:hypothetical protein
MRAHLPDMLEESRRGEAMQSGILAEA